LKHLIAEGTSPEDVGKDIMNLDMIAKHLRYIFIDRVRLTYFLLSNSNIDMSHYNTDLILIISLSLFIFLDTNVSKEVH
jgi:hypothetical protein